MSDLFGLLFSLPTESVAVRAAIGSAVGVALTALLLRVVLTSARIRTTAALLPIAAILGAVVASWGHLQLPMVMATTEADAPYGPFLVRDTYVAFAPLAWPLLAIWIAVTGTLVSRRIAVMRRMRTVAANGAPARDLRLRPIVDRAARELGVRAPRVVAVQGCPGGAALVGIRRATIVVDAAVLRDLDDEELEGLIAHELAHVKRRDNLLALLVGLIRDICFFVPGGRWVSRRLCEEREFAADQVAIGTTGRPGALASGLLKVIDVSRPTMACAAFAAPAAVVTRVERLVGDDEDHGPLRTLVESASVAGALTLSVAIALQLPAAIAAPTSEDGFGRNAIALLWTWQVEAPPVVHTEPTAFDVYRRSTPYEPPARSVQADAAYHGQEFNPVYLRGERDIASAEATRVHTRSAALARHDEQMLRQWRATPVVAPTDRLRLYWLHELESGG